MRTIGPDRQAAGSAQARPRPRSAAGWLAVFATALWASPLLAQRGLDPQALKAFGGTYMLKCGDNNSPKATVFADALVYLHGERRVAGRNVQQASSFFGRSPPPDYRTALLSEVAGAELMFFLFEDRAGYYLTVDGDSKVVAAIGKAMVGKKFRRCDGAPKPMHTAAAPPARSYQLHELSAPGLLQDPKAKAVYLKALGPLAREPWLATLDGPSPQNRLVKIAGQPFVLASACKNHDCADHNTVLLYSAEHGQIFGKVYQRGRSTLIGAPPPAVVHELDRLWRSEWRKNR